MLPIESNKVKECIQELVYDPCVEEEVDANIEEEGGEVRVSRGFLSINSFQDCVLYYKKTMNVCHLLLASGRPCQHDRKTTHGRRCSAHIMYKMVHPYYLQPKKRKVNPKPMVKMKVGSFGGTLLCRSSSLWCAANSRKLITQSKLHHPRRLKIHTNLVATKSTWGQVLLRRESPDAGHFKLLHPNPLVNS